MVEAFPDMIIIPASSFFMGSGAGHILYNDVRVPGNVLGHMAGENARVLIVKAARGKTNDDADGFVLVERRSLSLCRAAAK